MSCESGSNKSAAFSRLTCGISKLAGKRGFYAGLALGGTGLLGAGLVALRRRGRVAARPTAATARSRPELPARPPAFKPLPRLPARTRIGLARVTGSERCATCGSRASAKPGPWYRINGRSYCQDCAPEAARQADVDLAAPPPPALGGSRTTKLPDWRQAAGVAPVPEARPHLPPEKRKRTQLRASRVRVYAGQDGAGQPVYVDVSGGFVVVEPDQFNPDGVLDTGLAIIPGLKPDPVGGGIIEDTSEWYLVHIPSGKTIPGACYRSLKQAELLASILAQLDWNRAEGEMSTEEIRLVGGTVSYFNQALQQAISNGKVDAATTADAGQPAPAPTPVVVEPLTGKLVADRHGGVARVLEDAGEKLFLVDSLGRRYEVYRDEVREPQERDFELMRIARTVDPKKEPAMTCARCGCASSQAVAGESWYRMDRKSFCGSCGPEYAAAEAYVLDSEINTELEPMEL